MMQLWILLEDFLLLCFHILMILLLGAAFLVYWSVMIWVKLAKFCWKWCVNEYGKRTIL